MPRLWILRTIDSLVHTIARPTSQQYEDWQATIQKVNPLLVVQVISSQSEDQAIFDIQKALEVKSCPSMGLHLLGAEDPNLVLSKSCNINQLENAIVCDFATHHVDEIVQWVEIPHTSAQSSLSRGGP